MKLWIGELEIYEVFLCGKLKWSTGFVVREEPRGGEKGSRYA